MAIWPEDLITHQTGIILMLHFQSDDVRICVGSSFEVLMPKFDLLRHASCPKMHAWHLSGNASKCVHLEQIQVQPHGSLP